MTKGYIQRTRSTSRTGYIVFRFAWTLERKTIVGFSFVFRSILSPLLFLSFFLSPLVAKKRDICRVSPDKKENVADSGQEKSIFFSFTQIYARYLVTYRTFRLLVERDISALLYKETNVDGDKIRGERNIDDDISSRVKVGTIHQNSVELLFSLYRC